MLARSVMNTTPELLALAKRVDSTRSSLERACSRSFVVGSMSGLEDAIARGRKLPDFVNAAFEAHSAAVSAYWRKRGVI